MKSAREMAIKELFPIGAAPILQTKTKSFRTPRLLIVTEETWIKHNLTSWSLYHAS